MRSNRRQILTAYAFIAPVLLGTLIFSIIPFFLSFYNSFFFWNGINPREFIGWEHFEFMFELDTQVQTSFKATLTYLVFHVPAVVMGGLVVAVLLNNHRLKGLRVARTLVLTPLVTAPLAIAAIWLTLFNPNIGVINSVLESFGGEPVNWLGKPEPAMGVLLIVSIWRGIGYSFIFLLAGLQSIPVSYQEAARVDGATNWQVFTRITLPLLTPSLFMVLVLVMLGAAQEFDLPLVLTNGAPRNSTSLVNLTIYRNAFEYGQMGYASAIASVTFVFLFFVTLVQFALQRRWVFYLGDKS